MNREFIEQSLRIDFGFCKNLEELPCVLRKYTARKRVTHEPRTCVFFFSNLFLRWRKFSTILSLEINFLIFISILKNLDFIAIASSLADFVSNALSKVLSTYKFWLTVDEIDYEGRSKCVRIVVQKS